MLELSLFTSVASKDEYMNMEMLNPCLPALVNAFKNYDVAQGELFYRSIVHDLSCFPYYSSSIPQLADMDVLCNLLVSGGELRKQSGF
ncbi:histone acetyltransferase [Trifolium repens]|nr:histone acetyltransferase [Trifolium repens]